MVKQGYKQTEIGVIPEDWDVKYLCELTNRIGDGIHSTPLYSDNDDFYFINGNNLGNGRINIDSATKTVSYEQYKFHKRDLTDKTILLSINGTIGNIAFFRNEPIILGKSACYINLKNGVNKIFLFYILQSNLVQKYFDDNLTGSTIKNLGLGTISNTQIPLPPLPEQEAIAEALSDADAWIESLEQLIAKKRLIKQGAMQELLTPKDNWEVKKLGEVVNIVKGQQFNSEFLSEEGEYPCFSGGINPSGFSDKFNERENTIIISEGGNSCGYINYLKTKFWLGGHCYKIVFKSSILEKIFTYQLLKYNQDKIMALRVGSGLPNIQKKSLEVYVIQFPSLSEQERIATILSDMDTELEALEKQLGKALQIKQGMMQELLTGRIRLEL